MTTYINKNYYSKKLKMKKEITIITIAFILTKTLLNANGAVSPDEARILLDYGLKQDIASMINLIVSYAFVITSYLLIRELTNSKKALITTIIVITSWIANYWTTRISEDALIGLLVSLSILLAIKNNPLSGLALGISAIIRPALITLLVPLVIYSALTNKKKYLLASVIPCVALIRLTELIPKINILYYIASQMMNYGLAMGLLIFIGLVALLSKPTKSNIMITMIIITYFATITFISTKESRLIIAIIPLTALSAVIGGELVIKQLTKQKELASLLLIILTAVIATENIVTASNTYSQTKNYYSDLQSASDFVRNYNKTILSNSANIVSYYLNKKTEFLPDTYEEFNEINNTLIIIDLKQGVPAYFNETMIKPLRAYPKISEPRVVIYQKA